MKNALGDKKYAYIYRLNTKYSRGVPLIKLDSYVYKSR